MTYWSQIYEMLHFVKPQDFQFVSWSDSKSMFTPHQSYFSRNISLISYYNKSLIGGMNSNQRSLLHSQGKSPPRQSPPKRESGCLSAKGQMREPRQMGEAQALRQISFLFNKNVNTLSKNLRQLLGDVDTSLIYRPSSSDRQDIESQRERVYNQGLDRLTKCLLTRNSEARRTIQSYSLIYREKFNKPAMTTITTTLQEPKTKNAEVQSKSRIRPISSKPLRQVSRSLIVDGQRTCREPPVILSEVTKFADIERKQIPKYLKNVLYSSRFASVKAEKSQRSQDPSTTLFQLGNIRRSFLECTGLFLPAFSQRKTTSRPGSSASQTQRDDVAEFRARINVLNSNYQVKVAKPQQTYKRRQRDPSFYTNIFI